MHAYEEIITDVNTEADKLISEEHPDSELIESKKQELNLSWDKIKASAADREKGLENNHEIQQFNRYVETSTQAPFFYFVSFLKPQFLMLAVGGHIQKGSSKQN